MNSNIIKAPFTEEQVAKLNSYQQKTPFIVFTCGSPDSIPDCKRRAGEDYGALIATEQGRVCPCGKYTQNWASKTMLGG